MTVLEFANKMDVSVEKILNLCKKLGINVSKETDILTEDDMALLEFELEESQILDEGNGSGGLGSDSSDGASGGGPDMDVDFDSLAIGSAKLASFVESLGQLSSLLSRTTISPTLESGSLIDNCKSLASECVGEASALLKKVDKIKKNYAAFSAEVALLFDFYDGDYIGEDGKYDESDLIDYINKHRIDDEFGNSLLEYAKQHNGMIDFNSLLESGEFTIADEYGFETYDIEKMDSWLSQNGLSNMSQMKDFMSSAASHNEKMKDYKEKGLDELKDLLGKSDLSEEDCDNLNKLFNDLGYDGGYQQWLAINNSIDEKYRRYNDNIIGLETDISVLTKKFLESNASNLANPFLSFETMAKTTDVGYYYVDSNGIKQFVYTLGEIPPSAKDGSVEAVTYYDICYGTDSYKALEKVDDDSNIFNRASNYNVVYDSLFSDLKTVNTKRTALENGNKSVASSYFTMLDNKATLTTFSSVYLENIALEGNEDFSVNSVLTDDKKVEIHNKVAEILDKKNIIFFDDGIDTINVSDEDMMYLYMSSANGLGDFTVSGNFLVMPDGTKVKIVSSGNDIITWDKISEVLSSSEVVIDGKISLDGYMGISKDVADKEVKRFKDENAILGGGIPDYNGKYYAYADVEDSKYILNSIKSGSNEFIVDGDTISFIDSSGKRVYVKSTDNCLEIELRNSSKVVNVNPGLVTNSNLWKSNVTDFNYLDAINYIYNTGTADDFNNYVNLVMPTIDNRWVDIETAKDQYKADVDPLMSSVESVVLGIPEGFSTFAYAFEHSISGEPVYKSRTYSHGDTMRSRVSNNIRESGVTGAGINAFFYDVGMSIADNLFTSVVTAPLGFVGFTGGVGLGLAVSSFDNTYNDALSRGLDQNTAFIYSVSLAALEGATEQISFDNLVKVTGIEKIAKLNGLLNFLDDANVDKALGNNLDDIIDASVMNKLKQIAIDKGTDPETLYRNFKILYSVASQSASEGLEEYVSSSVGRMIDNLLQDKSNYSLRFDQLIREGKTEVEAVEIITSENINEDLVSTLSGMVSGGAMAGPTTIFTNSTQTGSYLNALELADYSGNYESSINYLLNWKGTSVEANVTSAKLTIEALHSSGKIDLKMKEKLNKIVSEFEADNSVKVVEAVVQEQKIDELELLGAMQSRLSAMGENVDGKKLEDLKSEFEDIYKEIVAEHNKVIEKKNDDIKVEDVKDVLTVSMEQLDELELLGAMQSRLSAMGENVDGKKLEDLKSEFEDIYNEIVAEYSKVEDVKNTEMNNDKKVVDNLNPSDLVELQNSVKKIFKKYSTIEERTSQLAYLIANKKMFGNNSNKMALISMLQNLKMEGQDASFDQDVLTSLISGIGVVGIKQEHLLTFINKIDLTMDDVKKYNNLTDDSLSKMSETDRNIKLSQAVKNYLDTLINGVKKEYNISSRGGLKQEQISGYMKKFDKKNSDKSRPDYKYGDLKEDNSGKDSSEGIFRKYVNDKIIEKFNSLSKDELGVIAKYLNKDVKDVTSSDYKRFSDIRSVISLLSNKLPKGFDLNNEELLYGIDNDAAIECRENLYNQFLKDKSLISAVKKAGMNNIEKIKSIGLYNIIDAINQYAYQYIEENGITLEDGKLAIEMLAAKDPDFYNNGKEDMLAILGSKYDDINVKYTKITETLSKIAKKSNGILLGYANRKDGIIEHSIKDKDSASRKMYSQWLNDLNEFGYKLDTENPKNADGEYQLIGIGENNKEQRFIINKDGFICNEDGKLVEVDGKNINIKLDDYVPKDLLRYTITSNAKNYVSTVISSIKNLELDGYKIIGSKFSWPGSFYQGVNLIFEKDSQVFELQFHTEESFYAKDNGTHLFYEIKRNKALNNGVKSSVIQDVADYAQMLIQSQVEVPVNASKFSLISDFIEYAIKYNKKIPFSRMNEIAGDINALDELVLEGELKKHDADYIKFMEEFINEIAEDGEFSLGDFLSEYFEISDKDMITHVSGLFHNNKFSEINIRNGLRSIFDRCGMDLNTKEKNISNFVNFFKAFKNLRKDYKFNDSFIEKVCNIVYNNQDFIDRLFNNKINLNTDTQVFEKLVSSLKSLYSSSGEYIRRIKNGVSSSIKAYIDPLSVLVDEFGEDVVFGEEFDEDIVDKEEVFKPSEDLDDRKVEKRSDNLEDKEYKGYELVKHIMSISKNQFNGNFKTILSSILDGKRRNIETYYTLVNLNGTKKKIPSKNSYDSFVSRFNDNLKYEKSIQPFSFYHFNSEGFNKDTVKHRLYFNTEYETTFRFLELFANKCEQRGIPFYFKTAFFDFDNKLRGIITEELSLTRSDSAVIYASDEFILQYIEICKEIKEESADIEFYNPPVLTASIDGWIGYGTEPGIPDTSFNSHRESLFNSAVFEGIYNFINSYSKQIIFNEKTCDDLLIDSLYDYIVNNYKVGNKESLYRELSSNREQYLKLLKQSTGTISFEKNQINISEIREHMVNKYLSNDDRVYEFISDSFREICIQRNVDPDNVAFDLDSVKRKKFEIEKERYLFSEFANKNIKIEDMDSNIKVEIDNVTCVLDKTAAKVILNKYVKLDFSDLDVRTQFINELRSVPDVDIIFKGEVVDTRNNNREYTKRLGSRPVIIDSTLVEDSSNDMEFNDDKGFNSSGDLDEIDKKLDSGTISSDKQDAFKSLGDLDETGDNQNEVKIIEDIKKIIESHNKSYAKGDALLRLKIFVDPNHENYGNYNMISSSNGARSLLMKYKPEDIAKYLSRFDGEMISDDREGIFNSSKDLDDRKVEKRSDNFKRKDDINKYAEKKKSSFASLSEYMVSISKDQLHSNLKNIVSSIVQGKLNGNSVYNVLVEVNSPLKKEPSRESYNSFIRKFGANRNKIFEQISNNKEIPLDKRQEECGFIHFYSHNFDLNDISQRLYFNAEYETTFKFLELFANKCEQKGIPFYFKTAFFDFNFKYRKFVTLKGTLERSESAVIYSNDKYLIQYTSICREIANEHPEFKFYNPPVATTSIDGWLGYGEDPNVEICKKKDVSRSFNSVRACIFDLSISNGIKKFIITYADNIFYGNKTGNDLLIDSLYGYIVNKYKITDSESLYRDLFSHKEYYLEILKQDVKYFIFSGDKILANDVRMYMFNKYLVTSDAVYKFINDSIRDVSIEYGVDPDNFAINLSKDRRKELLNSESNNDLSVNADKESVGGTDKSKISKINVDNDTGKITSERSDFRKKVGIQFFAEKSKSNGVELSNNSALVGNIKSDSDVSSNGGFIQINWKQVRDHLLFTKESVFELFDSINKSRYYNSEYRKEEMLFGLVKAFKSDEYYFNNFRENNLIAREFCDLYYANSASLNTDSDILNFVNRYVNERTIPGSKISLDMFNIVDIFSPFNNNKYGISKLRDRLINQFFDKVDNISKKITLNLLKMVESSIIGEVNGVVNYSIISEFIFKKYEGMESQFEKKFGFPMYLDGGFNKVELMADMFISVLNYQYEGKSIVEIMNHLRNGDLTFNFDYISKYLVDKGIIASIEDFVCNRLFDSRRDIAGYTDINRIVNDILTTVDTELNKGSQVIISLENIKSGFANSIELRDVDGKLVSRLYNSEGLSVLGVTTDGRLIVKSNNVRCYIDLRNMITFGKTFNIDSVYLDVTSIDVVDTKKKDLSKSHIKGNNLLNSDFNGDFENRDFNLGGFIIKGYEILDFISDERNISKLLSESSGIIFGDYTAKDMMYCLVKLFQEYDKSGLDVNEMYPYVSEIYNEYRVNQRKNLLTTDSDIKDFVNRFIESRGKLLDAKGKVKSSVIGMEELVRDTSDNSTDSDSDWIEDEDFGIDEDDDDGYELKDGESLHGRIGMQFFGGKSELSRSKMVDELSENDLDNVLGAVPSSYGEQIVKPLSVLDKRIMEIDDMIADLEIESGLSIEGASGVSKDTFDDVDVILEGKSILEIRKYLSDNILNVNEIYNKSKIVRNTLDEDEIRRFTYRVINKLSREDISDSLINMLLSLDDSKFKMFTSFCENSYLFENQRIFERALSMGTVSMNGFNDNIKLKLINTDQYINTIKGNIERIVFDLEHVPSEHIRYFLNRIDFKSMSVEDKIYIMNESKSESEILMQLFDESDILSSFDILSNSEHMSISLIIEKLDISKITGIDIVERKLNSLFKINSNLINSGKRLTKEQLHTVISNMTLIRLYGRYISNFDLENMYDYINKLLVEKDDLIDLEFYKQHILNFSYFFAKIYGLDINFEIYYEDDNTGGSSIEQIRLIRYNEKFFTKKFKFEYHNIFLSNLETIFHEIIHQMQHQDVRNGVYNVNTMAFVLDCIVRNNIDNSYYENNYKTISLEIDARYNSKLMLYYYLKKISPLEAFDDYKEMIDRELASELQLYSHNRNFLEIDGLIKTRDVFIDEIVYDMIVNGKNLKFLDENPILKYIYNDDGSRKSISQLLEIREKSFDSGIIEMINARIKYCTYSLDTLINEMYNIYIDQTLSDDEMDDIIDDLNGYKFIETILYQFNFFSDSSLSYEDYIDRIEKYFNDLCQKCPNDVENINNLKFLFVNRFNKIYNNRFEMLLSYSSPNILLDYIIENIDDENFVKNVGEYYLNNTISYDMYKELITVPSLVPYLCNNKKFLSRYFIENINSNFDMIDRIILSRIDSSVLYKYVTSEMYDAMYPSIREKFDNKYNETSEKIIERLLFGGNDE